MSDCLFLSTVGAKPRQPQALLDIQGLDFKQFKFQLFGFYGDAELKPS
jgi:hypothetical protein